MERTRTLPDDTMEALPIGGGEYVVQSTRYFWTARGLPRATVNRYTFAQIFKSEAEAKAFIAARQERNDHVQTDA